MNRNDPESYYAFDDPAREVLIKRYDCPTPWMNYLSNGVFHTMLSQAGGGLAWYRSPQIWRINRYRFYHLPTDRSGMYLYVRDRQSGEYWCPTCEPAADKPTQWKAAHGMGYTRFQAERKGIHAELTYFVGPFENNLVWHLDLVNRSKEDAELDLFAFVEFGMMKYLREVSWVCYLKHQMSVTYAQKMDALIFDYGVENQPKPDETPLVYLACNKPLAGYDGDRDEFIGAYRSESNPYVLEHGNCTDSTLFGGDPCGALQIPVSLKPGRKETANVFLGAALTEGDVAAALDNSRREDFVETSFAELRRNWDRHLDALHCELPDGAAERTINTWGPYQAQRNFEFSRNISFYATGTFRGVGFRDTAQDILGQTPVDTEASKDKLRLLLGQQYADGHTNHYLFPAEGWEPLHRKHSDNHLWPILAAWNIVMEEGTTGFLEEAVPFFDGGEATVYEHLLQSVHFTCRNLGANGLPLMLHSDWNDQMFKVCREGRGESFWTSMQLGVVLPRLMELARLLGREADAEPFATLYETQKQIVNSIGWDGQWYRRAIMDNGLYLGTSDNAEARLWLNAQTWAVMSGYAEGERGVTAMDQVKARLDTRLGIKLIDPPITTFPNPEDPLTHYNRGTGENAAVFCHANTWAVIAECMLGRGDRAWKYFHQLIPSVAMAEAGAWRYKGEPYVYASNLFGPDSDKFGRANATWLSGTSAWMYVAATQYILGLRPSWDGLVIDPCLPAGWTDLSVSRVFRGTRYDIRIRKAKGVCKGVRQVRAGGRTLAGSVVPPANGVSDVSVDVEM